MEEGGVVNKAPTTCQWCCSCCWVFGNWRLKTFVIIGRDVTAAVVVVSGGTCRPHLAGPGVCDFPINHCESGIWDSYSVQVKYIHGPEGLRGKKPGKPRELLLDILY